jgi:hypothetical protein
VQFHPEPANSDRSHPHLPPTEHGNPVIGSRQDGAAASYRPVVEMSPPIPISLPSLSWNTSSPARRAASKFEVQRSCVHLGPSFQAVS